MSTEKNIAIIGCSGAIGNAFTKYLSYNYMDATIHAFSRQNPKCFLPQVTYHTLNYEDESAIEKAAVIASKKTPLDMVIVATGILHEGAIMPEKSLKNLSAENFQRLFNVNTILPALIGKHFLPKLTRTNHSVFATLSARIGSISDNQLGGWYAYRASKAALNMIIKNASIEIRRYNQQAILVALHPGTVDSELSKPFQGNIPKETLFTPEYSVQKMMNVLENLTPEQSGKCIAWDSQEICP